MEGERDIAIGIDLGTTFSCVGIWDNNTVKIIPNQGSNTTPSYVAFNEEERLIGIAAKNQAGSNPKNTIYDAKRLIGRKYNDKEVMEMMKDWPFKIQPDPNEKPLICVTYKNEMKKFYAEEISAMVLSRLKEIAEEYL